MTEPTLVAMTKDGERLDVHPSCVADHQRMGWTVAPPQDTAGDPQAEDSQEPKRRGRPPKAKD